MSYKALTAFIVSFIAGRRQTKLDAFDKVAQKRLGSADAKLQSEILQERRELELRYETRAWLTNAARRAGQINLVTHAAKFTHGDAKNSSFFSEPTVSEGYLSTSSLSKPAVDAVGNAAILDVAKLLQSEVEGDSLLACLQRQDRKPFAPLAENDRQLNDWLAGFSEALKSKELASHKLAKQIYFPVADGYHLLNPLFSSSLAHALHQRLVALRFSDESKAAWKARKDGQWHPQPLVVIPKTAVMKFGGDNAQNISALNRTRGGRTWLLSSIPPTWKTQHNPPYARKTFFGPGPFESATRDIRRRLISLLISTGDTKNLAIRRARDHLIDEIIDVLFSQAADIQRPEWSCWTQNDECQLKPLQQLWLDPWRAQRDEAFRLEREKDDWQAALAEDFSLWLNGHLRRGELNVGKAELREWQSKPLFRRRLREMEQAIRSYRHA